MINNDNLTKIDFNQITLGDKDLYRFYFGDEEERGCEFSFANLYLWGRQNFAVIHGHIVLFSQFDRRSVYPYPLGKGDKKAVIDSIIADSHSRGIPCRITGLNEQARQTLEELYPGKFRFHCDEGSFDYVYSIDDLAELNGKKYHGKRNHLNRFRESCPDYTVRPISSENVEAIREMLYTWYENKEKENPNADFNMEKAALNKALRDYHQLDMEGLALYCGESIIAFTLASPMSKDTFDVHFEKADPNIQGAYTAINYEFARYLRAKYPDVRYLDREEDMGLEGLRKAKKSYHPCKMIHKCWACLLEEGYEY